MKDADKEAYSSKQLQKFSFHHEAHEGLEGFKGKTKQQNEHQKTYSPRRARRREGDKLTAKQNFTMKSMKGLKGSKRIQNINMDTKKLIHHEGHEALEGLKQLQNRILL